MINMTLEKMIILVNLSSAFFIFFFLSAKILTDCSKVLVFSGTSSFILDFKTGKFFLVLEIFPVTFN
jgi:hypothetical protein